MIKLKGNVIAIDTETTGLDPYYEKHKVFLFTAYSNLGESLKVYSDEPNFKTIIQSLFYDPSKELIAHNMKFDLTMLIACGVLNLRKVYKSGVKLHCTLLQSILINNLGYHNLAYLTSKYLKIDVTGKDVCQDWLTKNKKSFKNKYNRDPNYSDIPSGIIEPYAMNDPEWCLKLHYKFKKPMSEIPDLYNRELLIIFVTIEMEFNGLYIDIKKSNKLYDKSCSDLKILEMLIYKTAEEKVNLNSPKQMSKLLFKKLKLLGSTTTKTGALSTGTPALYRLISTEVLKIFIDSENKKTPVKKFLEKLFKFSKTDILLGMIIKYKELSKVSKTYYRVIVNQHIKTENKSIGYIHNIFNLFNTVTGRMSSGSGKRNIGLNVQSMSKVGGPRQCVIAKPGYTNIHNDYSQIELRLGAHYSKDKVMCQAIINGEDLHTKTAIGIFKEDAEDITKQQRDIAKTLNFGIWYGMGPKALQEKLFKDAGMIINRSQAIKYINNYKKTYPGVNALMKSCDIQIQKREYITNDFKRRNYVNKKESYKAVNYLIQGAAADVMKDAVVNCWEYIIKKKLDVKIILLVHDEIVFQISNKYDIKKVNKALLKIMNNYNFSVPLKTDSKYYKGMVSWEDKKDL